MIEQRTDEWFMARCGKATASRIADIVAKTRSGWGASRKNYQAQLVAERLTGTPTDGFTSAAMQWGTDTEPLAREAYEQHTGKTVELVGFVDHPVIEMTGASPDGLVEEKGLVEIKCPNTATHIDTLLNSTVPKKYFLQMQWQLACTDRNWCDFISFDPRMPAEMQLWVKRVEIDRNVVADLEEQVEVFLAELADTVELLREKYSE